MVTTILAICIFEMFNLYHLLRERVGTMLLCTRAIVHYCGKWSLAYSSQHGLNSDSKELGDLFLC